MSEECVLATFGDETPPNYRIFPKGTTPEGWSEVGPAKCPPPSVKKPGQQPTGMMQYGRAYEMGVESDVTRVYSNGREPKEVEVKTKFRKKAKKYLSAEASLAKEGPVSLAIFNHRKKTCSSCDKNTQDESKPDSIGYCGGGCGCKNTKRAALSVKLTMPRATCPLELWAPAPGIGRGPIGRFVGIFRMVWYISQQALELATSRFRKQASTQ
tara:strand:- start:586 stop:1221 length:636 start_codon:yes stop_codon:yes gene_type:complete